MREPSVPFSLVVATLLAALTLLPRSARAESGFSVGSPGGWIVILTTLAVVPNVVPLIGNARCVHRHQRSSGWGITGLLVGATSTAIGTPLFVSNGLGNGDGISLALGLGAMLMGATNLGLGIACLSQPDPPPRAARWHLGPWGVGTGRESAAGAALTLTF